MGLFSRADQDRRSRRPADGGLSAVARFTFRLPDIGEGIAEAEIVAWHVKVGDRIEEDGRLADVMTDKATVEMESPVSGIVLEVAGEAGAVIAIGSALAVIETEGDDAEDSVEKRIEAETPTAEDVAKVVSADGPAQPVVSDIKAPPVVSRADSSAKGVKASPAVRTRARALGIDLGAVPAGPDGIVRHADLDAVLTARAATPPSTPATPTRETEPKRPVEMLEGAGEQIKVIGLRRRIAENMAASKRHIPHFSYVEECDVTALEALRGELNNLRGERPKLTLLPFMITAICRSLPEFPMINARFDDEAGNGGGVVTRYDSVHLGIAAQTPAGLMVPVIRNAQTLDLWALAAEISRLAQAARDGTAKSAELSGSTLTVTSLGSLGGIATTPVINRPEVAIIGPNRIVERPMFVPDGAGGEQIEKRKLMNMSISCDHRVVDGWDAARFVQAVRRGIEAPLLLVAG
jgi:2-oxoisovalerate dehydrogenase E2 component (dihydrolipoyl transacylase)